MVASADTSRLTGSPAGQPLATIGAAVAGAGTLAACLAMPVALLEAAVVRGGIASLIGAAAPPLGLTARLLIAAAASGGVAAVGWALLVLVAGERRVRLGLPARLRGGAGGPTPRPPILAERDLGVPFLSVVAPPPPGVASPPDVAPAMAATVPAMPGDGRPVPVDLDTALAAVDPGAIPAVARQPAPAVPPLAPPRARAAPLEPGERIDSIELGADARGQPDTIEMLLARLERGARRRPVEPAPAQPPSPAGSLEETLGTLRRLATSR